MKRFYSFFIIVIITAFVFSTAGFLIGTGLADKNSNLKVARRWIQGVMQSNYIHFSLFNQDSQAHILEPQAVSTQSPYSSLQQQESCNAEIVSYSGISLVDYLNENHEPASFAARVSLAEKYRVTDYTGSALQNRLILQSILREKFCGVYEIPQSPRTVRNVFNAFLARFTFKDR